MTRLLTNKTSLSFTVRWPLLFEDLALPQRTRRGLHHQPVLLRSHTGTDDNLHYTACFGNRVKKQI